MLGSSFSINFRHEGHFWAPISDFHFSNESSNFSNGHLVSSYIEYVQIALVFIVIIVVCIEKGSWLGERMRGGALREEGGMWYLVPSACQAFRHIIQNRFTQ